MPLDPPWMSADSPAFKRPRSKTLVHTVKNVSGIAAALVNSMPSGTGRHWGAGATQVLGVPATGDQRTHPIADLPAIDARSGLDDGAGHLQSGDVRRARRRRVQALPLHHVRAIDAGCRHLDQDLTRTSRRPWTFGRDEHLGAARLTDFDHQHVGQLQSEGPVIVTKVTKIFGHKSAQSAGRSYRPPGRIRVGAGAAAAGAAVLERLVAGRSLVRRGGVYGARARGVRRGSAVTSCCGPPGLSSRA